jgi:hypothetical protein
MKKRTPPKTKPDKQSERFIEKARELGCDEDEASFEKRLKKIANTQTADATKEEAPLG